MGPTYTVIPGKAIGMFGLGDSLWHILDLLRTHQTEYPKVEISWDPERPHQSAVTIHLPHLGLYFPHPTQCLELITIAIPAISSLTLTYESHTLSSTEQPLTRAKVGKILGPTYVGKESSKLSYPGIVFDIMESVGMRDDVVDKVSIMPRNGEKVSCGQGESVHIQPGKGIILHLPDPHDIILGETTAQDLLLDLGPPLRKYWKEDDRLEKMWGSLEGAESSKGSCFWNYFQLGLDFLISPEGLVNKIIVHSNIPGTALFQRYARCAWVLPTASGDLTFTSPASSFRSRLTTRAQAAYLDEVRLTVPSASDSSTGNGNGKKKKRPVSPSSASSVASSKSGEVDVETTRLSKHVSGLSNGDGDAMMLDRVVEGGLDGVIGVGPSRIVGFDGLVIEEDQETRAICSILVWRE